MRVPIAASALVAGVLALVPGVAGASAPGGSSAPTPGGSSAPTPSGSSAPAPSGSSAPAPVPMPPRTMAPPASAAAASPQVGLVTRHGGSVLHSVAVYTLFWDPAGLGMTPGYQRTINQFYTDLSGTSTLAIAQQYTDATGAPTTTISLGGTYNDTTRFPSGEGAESNPVTQTDILNEVERVAALEGWAYSPTHVISVFLPQGAWSDDGPSFMSFVQFCAYHSAFYLNSSGPSVQYPVDIVMDSGTDPGACGVPTSSQGTTPNGDATADSAINVASHELFETITDPFWDTSTGAFTGWYWHDTSHEIGDQCAWYFGPNDSAIGSDGGDVTLNGHRYVMQEMWSNSQARARSVTVAGGCTLNGAVTTALNAKTVLATGSSAWALSATLTVPSTHTPLAGEPVVMTAGSTRICSGTTNGTGTLRCNGNAYSGEIIAAGGYTATFAGTVSYLPSSGTAKLQI